jgi:uracil-DNA glycosylase family 4
MSFGSVFKKFHKPAACIGCPAERNGRRFVPGIGELDECESFIIAEKPGENEDREGEPLVGKTGQIVEKANGGWGKTFRTNVRKCLAKDRDADDRAKSIAHCVRAYLVPEIERVLAHRPDDSVSVVLIGGDATRVVAGLGIQKYHGSTWTREELAMIAAVNAECDEEEIEEVEDATDTD